ncbi:hypothetical protein GCM10010106_42130 [Thermopolyspora flexuosa]|uniref:RNA polymerase sigma factor (Sigma-70 family) n=1 Tax=Thermopolyspora flexuosa TaxID=103836 RepID=A0A543IUT5_9ACTN|nr:sigma-70 family RNA polymerase sigma factor [Thermopolyspora flexuosa]TQM74319.1 RNA polymerase sigma factor (sigma-70 family) [Thermopolyspora flexuosa]GGM90188.1 hypothetical protein GCM10010106_42130 [Thermopolyspora flexuosa]
MPAWPDTGRATPRRPADPVRPGDAEGAASQLYDAYADRLNDYAVSLLHDQDAAAAVVHDTIVTAFVRADRPAEPGRLRTWLYAVVRRLCRARGRAAARADAPTAPLPAGAGTAAYPAGGGAPQEPVSVSDADPELATLVHRALAELDPADREVLDLAIRHGLGEAETAAVVGATPRRIGARLAHAREHLENAAAVLVLARTGRAHCPGLSAMLDGRQGPLTEPLRRRVARHVSACAECTEARRRRVSAVRLLDLIPIMYAPLSLRRRVLDTCADPARAAAAALGDEHFGPDGLPAPPDRRRGGRSRGGRRGRRAAPARPRRTFTLVSVLACLGLGIGTLLGATYLDATRTGRGAQPLVLPTPTPDAGGTDAQGTDTGTLAPDGGRTGGAPEETADPEDAATRRAPEEPAEPRDDVPARTPLVRVSAIPRSGPATSPPPRPRPRASSRPAPPRPVTPGLAVSCPATLGDDRTGVIRIAARGATLAWRATTTGDLVLSPARGRLKAGASALLTVTAEGPDPGRGVIRFESSRGARTCTISWHGESPSPSDSPTQDESPAPDSPPSPGPSSGDDPVTADPDDATASETVSSDNS